MTETFDQLYGSKGVDTSYEREKITYHPEITYTKKQIAGLLRPETKQLIERSRTFTISQSLSEYDELIADIDKILQDLEARNSAVLISSLKGMLQQNQLKEISSFEKANSGYQQTGDFEIYTLLYCMKASIETRRGFLDEKFRTQLTDQTELDKVQEAEEQAILEWEHLEARSLDGYKQLTAVGFESQELSYASLEKLDKQKRGKEILHTTMADTSYVHRNRYFLFLNLIEKIKVLVYRATSLIEGNLKILLLNLKNLNSLSSAKSHLILQFRQINEQHSGIKGKMLTLDDEKETFASEKHFLYQQMEVKTVEPIKNWLFSQEEGVSQSFDLFASYMVGSIQQTRETYEANLADMLNFYQSEADFYEKQIDFLKKKEEIRKFYSILEDLGEAEEINGEWVTEYLKANGYSV